MPRHAKVKKAVSSVIERLESRMLLTTVSTTVAGGPESFDYLDKEGNFGRVTVGGNTTVEFIFARVTAAGGIVFGDRVPPPPPNAQTDAQGNDLFHVYVADSDATSFITVAARAENAPFNLEPFTDNAGQFKVRPNTGGPLIDVTPAADTGRLILGTRTGAEDDQGGGGGNTDNDNIAILGRNIDRDFGVRLLATAGRRINAGFEIARGNNFGKFLFGGTIIGRVTIPNSMETFYAGNLWTGDARGTTVGGGNVFQPRRDPNFVVGGNLHSLIVAGAVGTDNNSGGTRPDFVTGFDMKVGGIIGHISAGDAWTGGVNVIHGRASDPFGPVIEEIEGVGPNSSPQNAVAGWNVGMLEGSPAVRNNSFDTPQYLPSYTARRGRSAVYVDGYITGSPGISDYSDYYGVPLIAGQTINVDLSDTSFGTTGLLGLGVYDPDGRLIATNYGNTSVRQSTAQAPIRITADRPGVYRVAVAVFGDADFNGPGGTFPASSIGTVAYRVTVTGAGDLALGGISGGTQLFDGQGSGYGFYVQNGDLGALQSGGDIISLTPQSVLVRKGNLRSMEGPQIGTQDPTSGAIGSDMTLEVPRGNVGLVRSTVGVIGMNVVNNLGTAIIPVGGDYQVVSAATTLSADLIANRSIGVIRAAQMGTVGIAPVFTVNADNIGGDGVIDLIDVTGDFGTLQAGGPQITTGLGGNVRYIHVGGQVFRDVLFGGGAGDVTTFAPGETVNWVDDSGSRMEIEPSPVTPNPVFVPGGTNSAFIGPTITVTSYGVRGSGGSVLIDVTSTGNVRVGGGGGGGTTAHAEIGTLRTTGAGNPVVPDANGDLIFSLPTVGTSAANLDVLIDGSGTVDVYDLQGSDFTSIRNRTPGEIVNINANATRAGGTIGSLEGYMLGVAKHTTPAAVGGATVLQNVYPFNQQRNVIQAGNILNVEASGPVGNIFSSASIGNVTANRDGKIQKGMGNFEGINGPIVAGSNIASVNIGQGIAPSGSGDVGFSGIYAVGRIGRVRNQGNGSDIRGAIVSNQAIDEIALSGGSIINTRVMVVGDFAQSRRTVGGIQLPGTGSPISQPVFQIGEINVGRSGGIIGSRIVAANIGKVTSRRGFGVINNEFLLAANGRFTGIEAEGYGIRGTSISGGSTVDSLAATAKPKNVSVLEYSPSVRQSERYAIDPFFNQAPTVETDLHLALGTSARVPRIAGVTDTGAIADVIAIGNRELSSVFANTIRGLTTFNFANSINRIRTRSVINGLNIITGRLKSFLAGGTVNALDATVAGPIDDFHVVGDLASASALRAVGPSGNIGNVIIDGNLDGDISSARRFHFLAVGRNLGAPSLVTAEILDKQQIKGQIFGTIKVG